MASIGGMGEGEGEIVWGRDWGSRGGWRGVVTPSLPVRCSRVMEKDPLPVSSHVGREERHTRKSYYHSNNEHFCHAEGENLQCVTGDIGLFKW